ncbi:MAG: DUF1926 domain-containing protein [Candidatus Latescibacteria bacterium]|nr:DUF1926 domain-containing protein [Candidatus Latescibacterota bacterium]
MPAEGGPVRLAVVIHNHQPVGNFDSVFSDATERAYRPFLDALARHPGVRIAMHWSGSLLEWLERGAPGLLDRLGELSARGQVELLSGAFYEPILPAIPSWDRRGQIERMNEYLRSRFGARPLGMWIAERVWEPDLPDAIARAGIEYTLLDDHHFLLAGEPAESLREPYWVETALKRVGVYPIERELRYRIPFQPVPALLDFLGSTAGGPNEVRVFGDDGEKFGVWPRTSEWVYRDGWLEAWLEALEAREDVEAVPLGEIWRGAPPRRSVALPAASYPEMMLWALPPERRHDVEADQRWLEGQGRADLARRIAGGTWRQFLARYPEARRVHRRVARVSLRIERMRPSASSLGDREDARREIHRAQCNCSYWHGVFGGFYLPHLRQSVHEHRLRAETLADRAEGSAAGWNVERADEELWIRSPRIAITVSLEDGGSITEIADRRRPFDFAGVIARRREAYHADVVEAHAAEAATRARGSGAGPETIHAAIQVKEPGLQALLRYDERLRSASQEWLVSERDLAAAGGLGAVLGSGPVGIRFAEAPNERAARPRPADGGAPFVRLVAARPGAAPLRKEVGPGRDDREFEVRFAGFGGFWLVSEWNMSLLTGDAPGRRLTIRTGGSTRHLAPGSQGEAESAASIRLEDSEYLKLALTLDLEPQARIEWEPVETVSLSESGVERVYQGSSFRIGWRPSPEGKARIRARIEEVPPGS